MGAGPFGPVSLQPDSEMDEIIVQELYSEVAADDGHVAWRISCYKLCQCSKRGYQGTG